MWKHLSLPSNTLIYPEDDIAKHAHQSTVSTYILSKDIKWNKSLYNFSAYEYILFVLLILVIRIEDVFCVCPTLYQNHIHKSEKKNEENEMK